MSSNYGFSPDHIDLDVIEAYPEKHVGEPSSAGNGRGAPPAYPCDGEKKGNQTLQGRMWMGIDHATKGMVDEAKAYKREIIIAICLILLCAWIGIVIWACVRSVEDAKVILILTCIGLLLLLYTILTNVFSEEIAKMPSAEKLTSSNYVKWPLIILLSIGIIILVILFVKDNPRQLISALGLIVFIAFSYIFSFSPRDVKWRPVLWGFVLQFILGVLILRTRPGFITFQWIGNVTQIFLDYSDEGAKFVFGDPQYLDHFFAFKVLSVVIYFSACISVLYYLGVMQAVIRKIAWLMQWTMKTSASESLNAAGNIFVGQTESPLMIRPILKDLTKSEIHAVMTGGFATIAGSVLGAYISFGISASHLISASVMSAPAALAIAKLFYPETEESKFKDVNTLDLPKSQERNVVEAASNGAVVGVQLVLNIAGNLIAFLAILALFNGVLGYIGGLLGVPELSFEWICSYLFIPVAFIMGVDVPDCRAVAELIGLKTFLNEFVAYARLSELISNGEISPRSEVIATYALCGFANIGSVGIQLGGLTPMAPSRASDLADVAIRALIAGTVACFMTACIAGLLYDPTYDEIRYSMTTMMPEVNSTLVTDVVTDMACCPCC